MLKTMEMNETKFKFGRPSLPTRTAVSAPDSYAKRAIDNLEEALGRTIWPDPEPGHYGQDKLTRSGKTKASAETTQHSVVQPNDGENTLEDASRRRWKEQLRRMLRQDPGDLLDEKPGPNTISLDMLLAKDGKTSLVYEVKERMAWRDLSFNARTLLQREALFHYLFADAVYRLDLEDPVAIASYMRDEDTDGGTRRLYETIVVQAVKDLVEREKIEVEDPVKFLDTIGPEVKGGGFSFEQGVFDKRIRQAVKRYAFDRETIDVIRAAVAKLGLTITPAETDFLVRYADKSKIPLTPATAQHLVTIALTQQRNATLGFLTAGTDPTAPADFSVSYHTETHDALSINRNNVLAAAQLFYVMTMGEELGVFTAADLLVTRYLSAGMIDIQSPELLQDLQNYVLNDEFSDLKTGRTYRRTSPERRRLFYRQVFNYGDSDLMEGMVSNTDFEMLWNVLMLETVKYIEKVEQSERPEAFVSRQNIAQAMEDLLYNLSTHSSGMAKVTVPVMYKELDFVIERIFNRPEIVNQLALHNSQSYWKVIERILQEQYQQTVNITALRNKAMYGHRILESVAKYTEQMIDDDEEFSDFVSLVEAFIIAGEQLETRQRSMFDQEEPQPEAVNINGNGYDGSDVWDF